MRSLRNAASHNVLVFLFVGVLALAIALASPFWFDDDTKTHAAPVGSVTQQASMPVVSQGVSVHGIPAWKHDGYTGSTVKIGIIDQDFKGFTNLMGTELPENTPIITRVHAQCYTAAGVPTDVIANCERSDGHGTSVAEIVADVAPSASLYISNQSKFKNNDDLKETVTWMIGEGVKVINHSIGYDINAPGDGSSGLAASKNHILDVINYAVASGIIWVNSGGNDALRTWYGPYREGPTNNNWHDFETSPDSDEGNTITLDAGTTIIAELRWDDTWSRGECDIDLHFRQSGTVDSLAKSVRTQSRYLTNKPYEDLIYPVGTTGDYYLAIKKWTCPDEPDWMQLRVTGTSTLGHYQGGHDVGVPAESNSAGMLAVGAARHDNTNDVRASSNRGPTVLPHPNGRTKPDIVGATCVATKTDPPEFCGTSGAAPHIAGLAALVRDRYPAYTPAQVANYLKTNALVRGGSVPNHEWGNGLAYLPPRGTISPPPSTVAVGTFTALTVNTNVPSPGIGISLNEAGDLGNLSFTSTCPGSTRLASRRVNGGAVIIRGCTAGTATVKVYDPVTGTSLQTYTVTVNTAPAARPTSTGTAISKNIYVGDTETIDAARRFRGSVAGYTALSSNPLAATASMSGSTLTITAVAAGSTAVTVTASNTRGNATQRYDLTIETPIPPAAVGTPATQGINIGASMTVNVSGHFTGNVDGYSASSSSTSVAAASMNGPILTITGVRAGSATITVTARNTTPMPEEPPPKDTA